MPEIHAVITNPYYKQPPWLKEATYKDTVFLARNSTTEEAVLFLTLLCGYNDVDIEQKPEKVFKELIKKDEVAIKGGIAFADEERLITPISYKHNELVSMLKSVKTDLLDFYKYSFKPAFPMAGEKQLGKLFSQYCKWFNLEDTI